MATLACVAPYIDMGSSTSVRYFFIEGIGSSLGEEVGSVEVALPGVGEDRELG